MMLKLPVVVMKMSAFATTFSSVLTSKPSIAACSAQIGSISRDDDAAALAAQRLRAALADFAVAEHDGDLAAEHDVGRAREAVRQRVAAAVDVVELALRDRVVDVDRREQQRAGFSSSRRGGARRSSSLPRRRGCPRGDLRPAARASVFSSARSSSRMTPHSSGSFSGLNAGHLAGLLVLDALVHATASRRRRRRRSASGPGRRATRALRSCTTSILRASHPSTRTPECRADSRRCRPFSGRPTTTAAAA